ncbi:MAG: ATP-binding protein, partial [Verrucomicrobiota bacterium]
MYFGIRGRVALLVMLATAASALLVAKVMTKRAAEVLRDHELVDLGDEASLRGWQIIDQVEGLRDDLINIAFSPTFQEDVAAGASQEQLVTMARGLCRRYWANHLRLDLITFEDGKKTTRPIAEKGTVVKEQLWFPDPDARAGPRLHLSPIQRLYVTRNDLPNREAHSRWEPIIWAVAPLDQSGERTGGNPTYVRIMMTLFNEPSPRHLFAMENAAGVQLVRHDESDPLERDNDKVFLALNKDPELLAALAEKKALREDPNEEFIESKVDRLAKIENARLSSFYYFQEGTPAEALTIAIGAKPENELDGFLDSLQLEIDVFGKVGGLQSGVREVRMMARSREDLAQLRRIVSSALETEFPEISNGIDWRDVVECDEFHSWAVQLTIGSGENRDEYLIHYAVLDDELASSIEHEMRAVQNVAFLVAGVFGLVGFLMAMHFVRPLKQMTGTAQAIIETHREDLYDQVAALTKRLNIKRRDEIGDIARASKRLFEELLESQEKLEHRVNDRTRELRRTNTELEKANNKLKSLSQEKDAFVAKVSHDLRQPLNAIFLQIEALKLSQLDESQKRDVDRIHAHAARELNLVNDILEYQKIIMGAETLSKDEVKVASLLQDLFDAYSPNLKEKPVGIEFQQDETLTTFTADDRRIRQILGNLIGNACKFTKEGSVSFEARSREINEDPWIEFTVTDTGRGMSPEEQAQAFVPFVSNKKDNAGGSGLGLSICKELV